MQRLSDTADRVIDLNTGWEFLPTEAGVFTGPPADADWLPAIVPGTAAQALSALGRWSLERPAPLADQDIWYRVKLPGSGPARLSFEGLATIAEIFLDGAPILASDSMFQPVSALIERRPGSVLAIGFRSLTAELGRRKGRRARWRPTMIDDQRLRLVRTTLLGHMPGWCPPVDAIGPYRPIRLVETGAPQIGALDLKASLAGTTGVVAVSFTYDGPDELISLMVGNDAVALTRLGDRVSGAIEIADVDRWWPASHGAPKLYPVAIQIGARRLDLGQTGFRTIAIDQGADGRGFALVINGVRVFCRGAVWTPADIVSLASDRATLEPLIRMAAAAGVNMLRVGGTMLYEARAFHDLCDEYGILVWQDFMFANCDYPADDAFASTVAAEAEALLNRLALSPSLAILCGGSEVAQQAAMMGLPPSAWTSRIFEDVLPDAVARLRPDVPFVASSPIGGELPFVADSGVTHYYGVGAYRRPLEDARRSHVRFASECLAFANVPEEATLQEALPVAPAHHPRWKAAVPRDLGASWDFEDVRDHYTALLYGVDVARLRTEDPARYLALARATTADVAEVTIGEWRRPGSPTAGALVWFWRDLVPGAGWGVVDALGRPKSIYHALKRAFRPLALILTDEGVNGLHLHVVNDGPKAVEATLSLACLRDGRLPVARGEKAVTIPARGGLTVTATELLGSFFDTTYAYRFGPAGHDVSLARLIAADGTVIAEATHWLPGRRSERHAIGLAATAERDAHGWFLTLSAERMAAHVTIADAHYRAEDNGFDLAPGDRRTVRLLPFVAGETAAPEGEIRAINATDGARYAGG
ncbi:glycoside hydrolase family 2 protein [Mesorhizobium sp. BR1-1-16]|uniref:glycosyl hydrolase 2 galactose-binding domain-containing protein n=1 Tax=Mesorhizobium sp. BR1-1-16 TaxID=2876653 RepID=UPI001CCD50F7|nr:glycoside hydrolase family 2 protein [Mesorhizobium sp. BR1-1-16]MBZ9936158.1 glycoside hydrolase family 2 protein [Mesorhizobium sp. BR1-1-16]